MINNFFAWIGLKESTGNGKEESFAICFRHDSVEGPVCVLSSEVSIIPWH